MYLCVLYRIWIATGFPECARFSSLMDRALFGGCLVLPWNGLGNSRGIALDATVSYIAGTQH